MRPIITLTVTAALTLWSLAPANGASKVKTESPSRQAEKIFATIDASSEEVADTAYQLNDDAFRQRDPAAHLAGLQALRTDINQIGSELRVLEAERSSLAPWEGQVLDEVLPLFHDAAVNTDQAIQTFNSDRIHLYSTSYMEDTQQITKDANKAAALLHDYLKLAKTRGRESKIEERLGEDQQF